MRTKSPTSTRSMSQLSCLIAVVAAALPANTAVAAETHPLVKRVKQIEARMREHEQTLLDAEKAAQEKPDDRFLQMRITAEKLNLNVAKDELRSANRERDQRISNLKLIQSVIVERMEQDTANLTHVLHAALSRLEAMRRQSADWIYSHRPLRRLASYRWPVRADDDLDELAARFADMKCREPDSLMHTFRLATRELEALGKPSLWDWERTGREFWLRYTATLFRSQLADDPAVPWRDRLKQDRENADLYRAGYLEVVRAKRPALVTASILRPLSPELRAKASPVSWAKFSVILTALDDVIAAAMRTDNDSEAAMKLREQTERKLMTILETQNLSPRLFVEARDVLGGELPSAYSSGPPARKDRLLRMLLKHQDPVVVSQFAATVRIPRSVQLQWFLSRPFEIDGSEAVSTWLEVFTSVLKPMPLWIDDAARNDKTPVEVRPGLSTLVALETMLAKSPYRLYFLRPDYLWIGPPDQRSHVEQRLQIAEAKAVDLKPLFEDSESGFIDTPWKDCLDFLAELHSIRKFLLRDNSFGPEVNLDVQAPAYQIIDEVARQAELEWEIFEGRLVAGPSKLFDKFRRARDAHLRRMVTAERLRLEGNRIGRALFEETETGFVETVLGDAADFLVNLHGVPIVIADDFRENKLECHVSGSNLAVALTLMLVEHELTWDTNGQVIAIGDEESVAELLKHQNEQLR